MNAFIYGLKLKFGKISQLTTSQLEEKIKKKEEVLILDVRSNEERSISHIQESVHFDDCCFEDKEKMKNKFHDLAKDHSTVVAYCSVGYRSSRLIKEVSPFVSEEKKLYNLEGGIFKWATEGRSLVDSENKPTVYVHPYNKVFEKLIGSKFSKYV